MPQSATPTGKPAARRRTSRILGLALVLLTLALALPAGASAFVSGGGGGWFKQSSGTTAPLYAVAFPDAAHGWAVGEGGTILVTTNGGVSPAPTAAPKIAKLQPASARRGATVTISGTDFGAAQGTSSVKYGATKCTGYVSWSDTRIKCKVPAQAKYGAVRVTVTTAAGKSNAMIFTVKR